MTWLGKILTFVVMIGAVVWAYFTAQAYVTRVNWKTELDRERVARKAADAALLAEQRRHLAKEDLLARQLADTKSRVTGYEEQIAKFDKDAADLAAIRLADQKRQVEFDAKQMERGAAVERTLKELATVRARSEFLENRLVALTLETENAKRDATRANNEAKLALTIADENAKKVEDLQARLATARAGGGGAGGTALRNFDKPPPPVLANLRGEVTDVAGDLVTLSIGIDSGLAVGTTLDIYRTEGGARYLGTVKVTSALNLFPKSAIVSFTPARNVPIDRLRPEELPKKGDEVRPLNALTGGQ